MTNPTLINEIFIWPLVNVLIAFYKVFSSFGLPGAFGLSIVALTLLIRFILYPFVKAQSESMVKMQRIKPHMDRIRETHKDDAAKQQQALTELYKEHGINPATGCLTAIIQLPVIYSLYNVLLTVVKSTDGTQLVSDINKIVYSPSLHLDKPWDPYFLGVNLGTSPAHWQTDGWYLLLIPVVTAALQFIQTKLMTVSNSHPEESKKPAKKKAKEEKSDDMAEFSTIMQKQMMYVFPLMIGYFSYTFPVGLSVYWNVFTLFGIMQQYLINRSLKPTEKKTHGK